MSSHVGPELPHDIMLARTERIGKEVRQQEASAESSDDCDDFAGPSVEDFNNGDTTNDEKAAKERLLKARIANLRQERGNRVENENDLKHDSWMLMKPDWAQNEHKQEAVKDLSTAQRFGQSLREEHMKKQISGSDGAKYDPNESLNAEFRKEIFRKASNMNDKFTRGS